MCDAAILKAEEQHHCPAGNENVTNPVDCEKAFDDRDTRCWELQEDQDNDEGEAIQGEVDVEAETVSMYALQREQRLCLPPPPADSLGQGTANNWTDCCRDGPHTTDYA